MTIFLKIIYLSGGSRISQTGQRQPIITAHKRSLREGNDFTFSVCSGGGRGTYPTMHCKTFLRCGPIPPPGSWYPAPPRTPPPPPQGSWYLALYPPAPQPSPPPCTPPAPCPPCPHTPCPTPPLIFFRSKIYFFLANFFFVQIPFFPFI